MAGVLLDVLREANEAAAQRELGGRAIVPYQEFYSQACGERVEGRRPWRAGGRSLAGGPLPFSLQGSSQPRLVYCSTVSRRQAPDAVARVAGQPLIRGACTHEATHPVHH